MAVSVVRDFAPIGGPHSVVIFEETCAEWTTACIGCFGQSITVATSYSTLGMGAVAEAVNSCSAPLIICNYKDVARVAKQVRLVPWPFFSGAGEGGEDSDMRASWSPAQWLVVR